MNFSSSKFGIIISALLLAAAASSSFWLDNNWYLIIAVFLLVGLGNLLPAYLGQSFTEQRQDYLLEFICETCFKDLIKFDDTIRVNIMVATWVWYKSPADKFRMLRKCFRIRQAYRFRNENPDYDLVLLINQGVAGAAYNEKKWAIGDREMDKIIFINGTEYTGIDRNLDEQQRSAVRDLRFICSYPIRKIKRRGGKALPIGRVIGVVNIDSRTKSFQDYIKSGKDEVLFGARLKDGTEISGLLSELADVSSYILNK